MNNELIANWIGPYAAFVLLLEQFGCYNLGHWIISGHSFRLSVNIIESHSVDLLRIRHCVQTSYYPLLVLDSENWQGQPNIECPLSIMLHFWQLFKRLRYSRSLVSQHSTSKWTETSFDRPLQYSIFLLQSQFKLLCDFMQIKCDTWHSTSSKETP